MGDLLSLSTSDMTFPFKIKFKLKPISFKENYKLVVVQQDGTQITDILQAFL